ncbi:MAG: histidine kinase [Flavobacteriaceae bacterium]
MKILRRHKTGIPKKYIYLSALLFSIVVIIQILSTEQNRSSEVLLRHIVLFVSVYFMWALLLDYMTALIKPFNKEKPVFYQVTERLISSFILVLFNLVVTNIIYYIILISFWNFTITEAYLDFQPYIIKSIIIRFLDVIIIGIILKFIDAYQMLQEQKLKMVTLENKLHISQLETLRNQLDPHFLFNTLHTLNTLIGYDDKKARSMIIKVTNLLRKILDKREKQLITFDEELEYFTNYLEIEEERFHDRLEVALEIAIETREIMVPTLMLQPLIENAFKHGIGQIEGKGIITLTAFIREGVFIISLSNTIPDNELSIVYNSTKVGLENLESRLQQVYGEKYLFSTKKEKDSFIATIKINHK